MEPAHKKGAEKPGFAEYDYSNFYYGAGDDPLNLLTPFARWYREALPNGYYLYQEALASAPTTHVRVRNGKTKEFQDLLNLGEAGRMNRPGTESGNWEWRFDPSLLTEERKQALRELTETFGRD